MASGARGSCRLMADAQSCRVLRRGQLGLIAATILVFIADYVAFQRREKRA